MTTSTADRRGPSLGLVIPTYNERENIGPLVAELLALPLPGPVRLFVVDDESPDGTGRLLDELAAREPRLTVLHRPGKLGLGTAYLDGFRAALAAGVDLLAQMDSDYSHTPADLHRVVAAMDDGCDVVVGSKYCPAGGYERWPWYRVLNSRLANALIRWRTGLPYCDCTSGIKAYRRAVWERVIAEPFRTRSFAFQVESLRRIHRAGFRIREIPIRFAGRRRGASKLRPADLWEALRYLGS